jgi:hypothetical protein
MHQQLWGYKVEWKSVSRGTRGKKVEYHCSRALPHKIFYFILTLLQYQVRRFNSIAVNVNLSLCLTKYHVQRRILCLISRHATKTLGGV